MGVFVFVGLLLFVVVEVELFFLGKTMDDPKQFYILSTAINAVGFILPLIFSAIELSTIQANNCAGIGCLPTQSILFLMVVGAFYLLAIIALLAAIGEQNRKKRIERGVFDD